MHAFAAAGLYTVSATVTDDDGGMATIVAPNEIVVTDAPGTGSGGGDTGGSGSGGGGSSGSSVTGGSWYTDGGKASTNVSARYHGSSLEGNIHFTLGSLDFTERALEWLVVTPEKATLSASGALKGRSGTFSIRIVMMDARHGGQVDGIRVRITDASGAVVYDSQPAASINSATVSTLVGGNLTIHR